MFITLFKNPFLYSKLNWYIKLQWTLSRNEKESEGRQLSMPLKHGDIKEPNMRKQSVSSINNLLCNDEPRTTLIPTQTIKLKEKEWSHGDAYSYPTPLLCKCLKIKLTSFANTFWLRPVLWIFLHNWFFGPSHSLLVF